MPAVATAGGTPTRLGKYEILSALAAGGMARIYIARTTGIGSFERHVVLKLITPERERDHTAVQMFLDEARLAAALNHQNVAQVFEVGEDAGIHYLAMEYVHGQDLRTLLAKAGSSGVRIPLELALTTVAGAASGLHHAHERRGPDGVPLGIVHRDVSPSNIMIGYDGSVKMLDFGIAKATARSIETQSGIIKGKFAYMAPEQCRGRDVDARSDVFSLGINLYEVSTQHRCFRADSDFDTMHRIVTGDVVRPSRINPQYPPVLEAIVMKALAVDPAQRYQSAGLLLEAIENFAVQSRMSLSTMALGRFMRETFGDQPEPWLNTSGRLAAMLQPKESTISSTDGGSDAAPEQEGDERSTKSSAARAMGNSAAEAAQTRRMATEADPNGAAPAGVAATSTEWPQPAEWNAKSYPSVRPSEAAIRDGHAGPVARAGSQAAPIPEVPGVARAMTPNVPRAMTPNVPRTMTPPAASAPSAPSGAPSEALDAPTLVSPPSPNASGSHAVPPSGPRAQVGRPNAGSAVAPSGPHAPIAPRAGAQHVPTGAPTLTGMPAPASLAQQPGNPFGATPGSGSGAGPKLSPVPAHAYANPPTQSHSELSYPRYEPTDGIAVDDLRLKPNRRPLFIGLGIVAAALVGFLVLHNGSEPAPVVASKIVTVDAAITTLASGSSLAAAPGPDAASADVDAPYVVRAPHADAAVAVVAAVVDALPPPVAVDAAVAPVVESIVIDVKSDPEGADVRLAGAKLGVTPLQLAISRSTEKDVLTVHHDKYLDASATVDLSADVTLKFTLKKDASAVKDPGSSKSNSGKSGSGSSAKSGSSGKESSGKSGTAKPSHKDCQPQGQINPFDSRPVCKP